MFESSFKEAHDLFDRYLPKTGSYYNNKRNYSYDYENNTNSTSLLSPYVRYRILSEEDIIRRVLNTHPFSKAEKYIQEIYWRTYWKGWLEHRKNVYDDYLLDRDKHFANLAIKQLYEKAIEGRTELTFFNDWVDEIKKNGYLHNHVRMWFASIWIFTLNLPWQLGANFFMEHLLDGDPASNTLSWRWVAGIQTKGKNYLARKSNITKYSNIIINNNIEINEYAHPKVEKYEYSPKEISINDVDSKIDLDSILIPSDELNFLTNFDQKFKYIFSGLPLKDYNDHNYSKKVTDHLKKIILSNFNDNEFYKKYTYEIHFDDYYNSFQSWISKYQIKKVGIPYVTKGNWVKIYRKIIKNNPSVNFVYLQRKYDKEAWKFSKKGFFNFKKHIPELISKL